MFRPISFALFFLFATRALAADYALSCAQFSLDLASDDPKVAREIIERATHEIGLYPDRNPDVYFCRATAYMVAGDKASAEQDIKKVLELDPLHPGARRSLAEVFSADSDRCKSPREEDVELCMNRLLGGSDSGAPGLGANTQTSVTSVEGTGYTGSDPAKDCMQASADLAIAACSEIIRRDPRNADGYNNRAVHHRRKGDTEQAIADYGKAIEIRPAADFFRGRGDLYLLSGKSALALADYTNAIELGLKSANLYVNRGYLYVSLGDKSKAIADFNKAIEIDPGYVDAYSNRAAARAALGRHANAVEDYTKAISLNPKVAEYYARRALSYEAMGNGEKAKADFRRALDVDARNEVAKEGLKRLAAAGPATAAAKDDASLEEARRACGKPKSEGAFEACTKIIAAEPNNAGAFVLRGNALQSLDRRSEALADYTRAIEIDPNTVHAYEAYFSRAAIFYRNFEFAKALTDMEKVFELNPNPGQALIFSIRGGIYERLGKKDEAIADYRRALALDPKDQGSINGLSRLEAAGTPPLAAKGDASRDDARRICANPQDSGAIAACTRLMEAEPHNATLYNLRGAALVAKRPDEAIADYTKAIEIDPKGKEAHVGYVARAFVFHAIKQDNAKALADIEKAFALNPNPNWANAFSIRGRIYVAMGRKAEAIADFERALAIDPKHDPTIKALKEARAGEAAPGAPKSEAVCAQHVARAEECHSRFEAAADGAAKDDHRACFQSSCDILSTLGGKNCAPPSFCADVSTAPAKTPDQTVEAQCAKRAADAEACHKRSLEALDQEKTAAHACVIASCAAIKVLGGKCPQPAVCAR